MKKKIKDLRSKIGAASELKAAAHFMKMGFHVSKALDPLCPFDLVLTDNEGRCSLIDVKTLNRRKTKSYRCKAGTKIGRYPTQQQKKMNISIYDQESDC